MLLDVSFPSSLGMVARVIGTPACRMCVMRGFLVLPVLMVFSCFTVMLRGAGMMLRRLLGDPLLSSI